MALQRIDTAFGPNPIRFNGNIQPQANANVFLGNTSFQFSTIYAATFSGTATNSNLAVNLDGGFVQGTRGAFSSNIVAEATTISSNVSTGALVVRGSVGIAGNINVGSSGGNSIVATGTVDIANNTQAISTATGALIVDGGASISTGNLYIGGSGGNAMVATGDLYNRGNIWATGATNTGLKTNQTTAFVFNETATTVRIGGAATTVSVGATTGAIIPNANAAVNLGSSTAFYGTTFTGNLVGNSAVLTSATIGNGGITLNNNLADGPGIVFKSLNEIDYEIDASSGSLRFFQPGVTRITLDKSGNLGVANSAPVSNLSVTGTTWTSGNITTGGWIIPTSNVSQNLGTTTQWWNIFYGVSTQARYADLAENYQADAQYEPGTVLEFGGEFEVTEAEDGTRKVAGVVSTNPAHLMNGMLTGPNVVPLALQGRTPCRVRGKISKGDMLISAGGGFARPDNNPQIGTVIGKALEDFNGPEGIIEVVVGRL